MIISADLSKGELLINGVIYPVNNKARSLRDGVRASFEVARSLPDNFPYDPRLCGPVKIRSDAWQLSGDGNYGDENVQLEVI